MTRKQAMAVAILGTGNQRQLRDTVAALLACERSEPLHVVVDPSPSSKPHERALLASWLDGLWLGGGGSGAAALTVEMLQALEDAERPARRDRAVRCALDRAELAILIEAGELLERDALRWLAFGRDVLLRRGAADVLSTMSRTLGGMKEIAPQANEEVRKEADRHGLVNRYLTGSWLPGGAFAVDRDGWEEVRPAIDAMEEVEGLDPTVLSALAAAGGVRCAWPVVSRSRSWWSDEEVRWRPFVTSGECWLEAAAFAPLEDEAAVLERLPSVLGSAHRPGRGSYLTILQRLHQATRADLYVEIGVAGGNSLTLATCRGIGVDPANIDRAKLLAEHPNLEIVRMTSNDFYARPDLAELFGRPVDLTFIDGLHLFDQALRDFINAERWASRDGVIVLHDVLPLNQSSALPPYRQAAWCGDVWRMVDCLAEHRPDLRCALVDCSPSGLLVVTGLDPDSTALADRYDEIVGSLPFDTSDEYLTALRRFLVGSGADPLPGVPEGFIPARAAG